MKTIAATFAILVLICDCVNIQHEHAQYFNRKTALVFPVIESFEEAMVKLPNLFRSIKQHKFLISPQVQFELSKQYRLLIDKIQSNELSQRQLIDLIQLIMYQNDEIRISLHVSVWNHFFYTYYKLPQHQYRDSYVFKLLQCMNLNGSNCKPNLHTFYVILFGIINNDQIQPQIELFHYIINIILPQYNIEPTPQIYHLQFRLFVNKRNINGITNLLMDHPEIAFPDATIQIFNHVLLNLPHYVQHERYLSDTLRFLMNEIMVRTHNIGSYNMNTYQILRKLYDAYPFLHDVLQKIHQPFRKISGRSNTSPARGGGRRRKLEVISGHDEVYRIMQRMKQIKLGYNTLGYANYNRFVRPYLGPNEPQLNTPNPMVAASKREWDAAVRAWRRGLHEYDNYNKSESTMI